MRRTFVLLSLAAMVSIAACSGETPSTLENTPSEGNNGNNNGNTNNTTGGDQEGVPETPVEKTILDERVVDYSAALRTASLKLVQALPTLQQIVDVAEATDKRPRTRPRSTRCSPTRASRGG